MKELRHLSGIVVVGYVMHRYELLLLHDLGGIGMVTASLHTLEKEVSVKELPVLHPTPIRIEMYEIEEDSTFVPIEKNYTTRTIIHPYLTSIVVHRKAPLVQTRPPPNPSLL